jgi:DNA polymerase-2
VLVFDYKSLYPSIIRTFLIDPAGLIEGLAHPDDAASVPASRRALAHRALPARHRATRVGRPRRSETPAQRAAVAGAEDHHEFVLRRARLDRLPLLRSAAASSITMRGHEIMHRTRELIEAQGYEVIYGDTDRRSWLGRAHDDDAAATIAARSSRK